MAKKKESLSAAEARYPPLKLGDVVKVALGNMGPRRKAQIVGASLKTKKIRVRYLKGGEQDVDVHQLEKVTYGK